MSICLLNYEDNIISRPMRKIFTTTKTTQFAIILTFLQNVSAISIIIDCS